MTVPVIESTRNGSPYAPARDADDAIHPRLGRVRPMPLFLWPKVCSARMP